MHTAIEVGICVVIFYTGMAIGFFLRKWLVDRSGYDGAILIFKDKDKILYSLELHEELEMLEYKNELILKVKPLPKSLDRK